MAIQTITFNPLDGSTAIVAASTADSKAVVAIADASTASTSASTAIVDASTADSKAVVAIADASTASTAASTAIVDASTADSKAVVAQDAASTAKSVADSGLSVATIAKAEADSAIGSEPDSGEFLVTDIKRNAAGSIVIDYNDSAIGS